MDTSSDSKSGGARELCCVASRHLDAVTHGILLVSVSVRVAQTWQIRSLFRTITQQGRSDLSRIGKKATYRRDVKQSWKLTYRPHHAVVDRRISTPHEAVLDGASRIEQIKTVPVPSSINISSKAINRRWPTTSSNARKRSTHEATSQQVTATG